MGPASTEVRPSRGACVTCTACSSSFNVVAPSFAFQYFCPMIIEQSKPVDLGAWVCHWCAPEGGLWPALLHGSMRGAHSWAPSLRGIPANCASVQAPRAPLLCGRSVKTRACHTKVRSRQVPTNTSKQPATSLESSKQKELEASAASASCRASSWHGPPLL